MLNGPGGPSVIGLGYDARGNLSNKNGQPAESHSIPVRLAIRASSVEA